MKQLPPRLTRTDTLFPYTTLFRSYAMTIISIANPKGGAGKTTLACILADQLSSNGASVAVVDADPNAIIAKWHERRTAEGRASPFAVIAKPSEGAMINTVDQLAKEYQFVIVDLEGDRKSTRLNSSH